MDIHPPKHPVRSLRDFAQELLTVTCGIVIALSLEAGVTWLHERELVMQTRADFRAEIAENRRKVADILTEEPKLDAWLQSVIALGEAELKHKTGAQPADGPDRSVAILQSAAWDTALATQAIRLLDYRQARALAALYNRQGAINAMSAAARDQYVAMAAYGALDMAGTDAGSQDELRSALKQLRIADAYTQSISRADTSLLDQYDAADTLLAQ